MGITRGAAGGLGGGARAFDGGLDDMARDLKNGNDFAYARDRPEHQQVGVDAVFEGPCPSRKGCPRTRRKTASTGWTRAPEAREVCRAGIDVVGRTATDRIREVFG